MDTLMDFVAIPACVFNSIAGTIFMKCDLTQCGN
ncbi:hypothetical protein B0G83_106140 [Paraburkholderia sp. BL21I4N1]|nr:hypothetical protein B0G83_106140 [Paraburkholderia sp. BL21I4N1]